MNTKIPGFSRQKLSGLSASILLMMVALTQGACSPGALFGNKTDGGIQKQAPYRKVNTSCSQLDLSQARLDVASSRKLITCLDSQGALGELGQMIQSLSDAELAPFVDSLNHSFLDQPKNLYAVNRIIGDLDARGELATALAGVGGLLEQDELISRSLAIFNRAYVRDGKVDTQLLAAIERLARELTADRAGKALDLGQLAANAAAVGKLWDRVTAPRELSPAIAESLVAYARSSSRLGRDVIDRALDGSLYAFLDAIVPEDSDGIAARVPQWSAVLDTSLASSNDSALSPSIAARVGPLFRALGQPISCMRDSRALLYTPMDVIREMSALPSSQARSFISRDKFMQLYVAAPLCAFPSEIPANYPALMSLAGSRAIEPLADLLRAAYRIQAGDGASRPVAELVIRSLSDPDFASLLPALSELQARGAWDDLLLLGTLPRFAAADREELNSLLKTLIEPLPAAGNASLYGILVQGFARSEGAELTAWIRSAHASTDGLAAAMRGLRAAYYVNDAHPILDLAREAMAEATRPDGARLLETMLKLSTHAKFQGSVRELSKMSRDGRLQDLVKTTLALFDRYARNGETPIQALAPGAALPALHYSARHDLSSDRLQPWLGSTGLGEYGACRAVDLSVHWDDSASPVFEKQLGQVAACANGDANYSELMRTLQWLSSARTEAREGLPPSRTIHALLIDAYRAFTFTAGEARLLADWMLNAVNDGRTLRGLRAIPILVKRSVIQPIVELAGPLAADLEARAALRRLTAYGATVLRRADFARLLAYVDDLYRTHPAQPVAPKVAPYDRERILRWISNKECATLPSGGPAGAPELEKAKQARLAEILDEYENAAVNHDRRSDGGKLRQSWTTPELKAVLGAELKKLGDPATHGPLARALIRFMARLKDPKQYPAGYLEGWLRKRANDRRLVGYLYPGETLPRVRLLNGLDRLAVTLLNADIEEPTLGNIGLLFIGQISRAWGDVPFEQRPAAIQAKYPPPANPPTLAEAIGEIMNMTELTYGLFGLAQPKECSQVADPRDPPEVQAAELANPKIPPQSDPTAPVPPVGEPGSDLANLQASLYNVYNTINVLKENVDDGGLHLMRDLFYELSYANPGCQAGSADDAAECLNGLKVAVTLVKTGVMRQAGRLMRDIPANDAVVSAFLEAMVDGAAAPSMPEVAERLFTTDPDQTLAWNAIDALLQLKSPEDIRVAKQWGLYGLAATDVLGKSRTGDRNELLEPALKAALPILEKHGMLLARNADLISDLATWKEGADTLRALVADRLAGPAQARARSQALPSSRQGALLDLALDALSNPQRGLDLMAMLQTLDASPKAHAAWDAFRDRWKALDGLPEYRALKLDELGRQALDVIELRKPDGSPLPAEEAALARKLTLTAAELLERNDSELVDQLVALAGRQPDQFNELLVSVSRLVENGELPHLLELMRDKLTRPAPRASAARR